MSLTPFTDIDQIKLGMRVICVYGGPNQYSYRTHTRYNQTGVIEAIRPDEPRIGIRFDNNHYLVYWYEASSFALIDQQEMEWIADQERRKHHAEKFL